MKVLVVLLGTFAISLLVTAFCATGMDFRLSGRIAMSGMLLFTSIGHFKFADGMALMLPDGIPARKILVYATGIVEILAAIGLLLESTAHYTATLLIVFFVLITPANIYAAKNRVDYEKATFDGNGPNYLWFRVPLQLLFIFWVWFFVLR